MTSTTRRRMDTDGTTPEVLVVGGIGVDDAVYLNQVLRPGMWSAATAERRSPAGSAATVAVAIASAGLSVAIAGAVGSDATGAWLCQIIAAAGVQCHIHRVDGYPSPRSLVLVEPSGERTIIGLGVDLLEHATAALPASDLSAGCAMLVVPAWRPQFSDLLRAARHAGARTVVGLRALAYPDLHADVAVGSERELGSVEPRTALDRFGAIVVTSGTGCAYAVTADGRVDVVRLAAEAVDSTGAGDAFLAGLVARLAQGALLPDALDLAAAWGAAAVTRMGTVAPPYEEVLQLLEGEAR